MKTNAQPKLAPLRFVRRRLVRDTRRVLNVQDRATERLKTWLDNEENSQATPKNNDEEVVDDSLFDDE